MYQFTTKSKFDLLQKLYRLSLISIILLYNFTSTNAQVNLFHISEYHYDNIGQDVGEFVELIKLSGLDATGYTLEILNSSATVIETIDIPAYGDLLPYVPHPTDASESFVHGAETYIFYPSTIPNANAGFIIRDPEGEIILFITTESSMTVDGVTSNTSEYVENSADPIGKSIVNQFGNPFDFVRSDEATPGVHTRIGIPPGAINFVSHPYKLVFDNGTIHNGNYEYQIGTDKSCAHTEFSVVNDIIDIIPTGDNFDCSYFNNTIQNYDALRMLTTSTDGTANILGSDLYLIEKVMNEGTVHLQNRLLTIDSFHNSGEAILHDKGLLGLYFENNGTVKFDQPTSKDTIDSDYSQTGQGEIQFHIDGDAGAGISGGHTLLHVTGELLLDGKITLTINPSFTPLVGTEIDLLTYDNSISNFFSTSMLPIGWNIINDVDNNKITAIKIDIPNNVACENATFISLSDDENCNNTFAGNHISAPDFTTTCNGIMSSLWYAIDITESDIYSLNIEATHDFKVEVYKESCDELNLIDCFTNSRNLSLPADTIYLLISDNDVNFDRDFNLCIYPLDIEENNIGINTNVPLQALDINGAIRLGDTELNTPGTIRFKNGNLEGFVGEQWKNLTNTPDNMGDHTATQNIDMNQFLIENVAPPTSASHAATKSYVDNLIDDDGDPYNELQNLILNGSTLSLSMSTDFIDLSSLDIDDSNEIQSLSINENTISLTNGGSVDASEISPTSISSTNNDSKIYFDESLDHILFNANGATTATLTEDSMAIGDILSVGTGIGSKIYIGDEFLVDGGANLLRAEANLTPATDDVHNLGGSVFRWKNAYLSNKLFLTTSEIYEDGTDRLRTDSHWTPKNNSAKDLGENTLRWRDAHIDRFLYLNNSFLEGKTISGVEVIESGTHLRPSNDDAYSLGSINFRWSEVFARVGVINTSDRRAKKDIQPLTYGLNEILKLRPVDFLWKEDDTNQKTIGLIAQEVKEIIPEVIKESSNTEDLLGIKYSDLVPVLIQSTQDQQVIINTLQTQISDLEKQVGKLNNTLLVLMNNYHNSEQTTAVEQQK